MNMAEQSVIDDFVNQAHGNLTKVRSMLKADPSLAVAKSSWGELPIQGAAQTCNRPIAELLLKNGAQLDIFVAAALGRVMDVRKFLKADPSLSAAKGVHGLPLMYFAAIGGDTKLAGYLEKHGAGVNDGADGGYRAIHAAAIRGDVMMLRWLVQHGADPNKPGFEGKTALDLAKAGRHRAAAEVLSL